MPSDVKAIVSAIALIVAAGLACWNQSPLRPEFSTFVMVTAVFMVIAMWIFPEAGVKKGDIKRPSNPTA
jgi:membrane protein YdbS with pleckstrin-like domain